MVASSARFMSSKALPLHSNWGVNSQVPKKQAAVLVGSRSKKRGDAFINPKGSSSQNSTRVKWPFRAERSILRTPLVEAAALREAHEEVGLDGKHVQVLGRLSPLETGTAFSITPVVALVDPSHMIDFNTNEVAHVFEVPMSFLMNPANHRRHRLEIDGQFREWYSMPYHDGKKEHFIWGATASMIRNFYTFLSSVRA
jgi:8-oxo-dGTP pyrophosphatase MutT (NUDIX family)